MDRYVCIEQLETSSHRLKQYVTQLSEAKKEYDTGQKEAVVKLQNTVKSLWQEMENILLCLSEYEDKELLSTAKKIYLAVKQYDYLCTQDYSGLCNALLAFSKLLPANETANMKQLARLANRADFGFYPTELEHVRLIKKAVCFPDTPVNLLDPCCGEGAALSELAKGTSALTYGAELAVNRADQAANTLDEVAYGNFFSCNISTGAFHCIFLNPPYISQLNIYGFRQRMEKTFLSNSLPYLAPDGLLIYIVPYYRATKEICGILCSALEHITVYRFLDAEFKKFRQVVFMGIKTTNKEEQTILRETEQLFQLMLRPQHIPLITEIPENAYSIPDSSLTVKQFRGSVVNQVEVNKMLQASDSITHLFDSQTLEMREQSPLLPLSLGHIGLIGGSGLMNGLIECETPHVIKGKVVKTSKTEVADSKTETTVRTITSNKMIFHVLTPDGLKLLT